MSSLPASPVMEIIGHAAQYSSTNLSIRQLLLVVYILSVITINIFLMQLNSCLELVLFFFVMVFLNHETDWAWLVESPESAI